MRNHCNNSGQALILLVVLMGGMLMMATAIAGLLMYYQLQQSNDAGRSTEAIFAADAGLEKVSRFYYYGITPAMQQQIEAGDCWNAPCTAATPGFEGLGRDGEDAVDTKLANGATYRAELVVPPTSAGGDASLSASGQDSGQRTIRSVRTTFLGTPVSPAP
jgi:hypothetical protein